MPYICPDAGDSSPGSSWPGRSRRSLDFELFRCSVVPPVGFCGLQEQPRDPLVSAASAIAHIGARAMERAALRMRGQ
jgi:hypothetical protein